MIDKDKLQGAIAFAREAWLNDGAEGETVHLLCDALEQYMGLVPDPQAAQQMGDLKICAMQEGPVGGPYHTDYFVQCQVEPFDVIAVCAKVASARAIVDAFALSAETLKVQRRVLDADKLLERARRNVHSSKAWNADHDKYLELYGEKQ